MHKSVAFLKCAVQDEMHVRPHQAKRKDDDPVFSRNDIYTVHPANEIFSVHKHHVHSISVSAEVPAIPYFENVSFDERGIQSKVGLDLPKQLFVNLHLLSRAASGCLSAM